MATEPATGRSIAHRLGIVPGNTGSQPSTPYPAHSYAELWVGGKVKGRARLGGLARFIPAHVAHSDGAVVGHHCHLATVDHVHVTRGSIMLGPLIQSVDAMDELARLVNDPGRGIGSLQRILTTLSPKPDRAQDQRQLPPPLAARYGVSAEACSVVWPGDSRMVRSNHFYDVRGMRFSARRSPG